MQNSYSNPPRPIFKQFLTIATVLLLMFQANQSLGQLTGIRTIPGDYATVALAVTDLNTQGVGAGGVIFNVAAGHTETLSGKLTMTATGTAANPITIQKSGAGANPVLMAYVGIEPTPSVLADGFLVLAGSDYVTIDGIDLQESAANTTTTTVMEFGYGLFKASDTDGCQHNIIRNCMITLDRLQNTAWTAPGHNGSVGIAVLNGLYTATGNVTVTAVTGSNSFNQFHSNTIQNCNAGITFVGFAAASPFDLGDNGNDIGGNSVATGNTILNFGGGATTSPATGIFANSQWDFNVSYNTINNNNGAGVNHGTTMRGIFLNTSSTSASANCNFNNITLTGGATTSDLTFIENGFGSTPAGNTVSISNNILTGSYPTATSGAFRGIYSNGATPATLNIQNNTISNLTHSNAANTGSGVLYPIFTSGSNAAMTINATGNTISNISRAGTSGGTTIAIYISAGTGNMSIFVNNNTVQNMSIDGAGTACTMYGIQTPTGTVVVNNNLIDGLTCIKTTGTSAMYGIYNIASPVSDSYNNNTIRNLSHAGTGTVYGLYANTTTGTRMVSNNLIHSLSTRGTTIAGMNMLSSSPTIFQNKIYDILSNSITTPTVSGIIQGSLGTAGVSNIYNNYIGDLRAPTASSSSANAPSVRGINVTTTTGNTSINISFNTIHLNATSTGTNFATVGLFVTTSTTATTANLTLKNNVIVNLSTPNGTGNAVAYQRSSTSLTNYNQNSNNNLFYAGTPGTQNLIFFNGTNANQTIADFKLGVSPAEALSVTENPPFLSIVGANATFLHINPAVPTQIESGGVNIVGITDDYDTDIRQGNIGYVGTGAAPDLGADEGDFMLSDLSGPAINYTPISNSICLSGTSLSATITDPSIVNITSGTKPRLWFKKSTENNVLPATNTSADNGWKWVEASNAATPFDFTVDYNLLTAPATSGDVIEYFVVAQDMVGTPNVGASVVTFNTPNPASVALAANSFPTSNTNSYTILSVPASVSSLASPSALCYSGDANLSLDVSNLGAEYQWESSPAGMNTWTSIPTAIAAAYLATGINSSMDYRCIISCNSVPVTGISPSAMATVNVSTPQVLTTIPGSACSSSPVSVLLSATKNSGAVLNWYDNATGGTAVATGDTFNTPLISSTTTYYVAASEGGSTESAGKPTYTTTLNTSGDQWGLVFDVVNSDIVINSVDVYSVGAGGQMSVELRDNTGALIQTVGPFSYPAGSTSSPVTVTLPLNLPVSIGTGYRLVSAAMTGNLIRETSGNTYPYTSPSGNVVLTSGFITNPGSATYYWFYNWQVSTGCESPRTAVVATITNGSSSGTDTRTECGSYTWINGTTYITNNNTAMYTIVGGAADGCDSIVTLNLTIAPIPTGTDTQTACGSYTWIDGNTYTASNNTAMDTIVGGAANGCDSIVILNLTITPPAMGTDVQTACGSYTWIDGNTYTASNSTAMDTIVGGAANGCDSIVTLNLTINNPTTGIDTQVACDTYTWIDGNTYTASNNTAMDTILGGAANGCDSIVTLNLTINTVDTVVTLAGTTLTANTATATYQWVDCNNGNAAIVGETNQSYTPTVTGDYAVEITENGCTSTSSCFNVLVLGLGTIADNVAFNVYPNPASSIITIEMSEIGTIELYNVTGQLIWNQTTQTKLLTKNIADLPSGVYNIRFVYEGGSAVKSFVVRQ